VFRFPFPVFLSPALLLGALFLAASPDEYQPTREAFVEQINAVRTRAGVRPLRLSRPLSSVAQGRADEIAAGRDVHSAVQEGSRRATEAGYEPRLVSEIAATADGDVAAVLSEWRREDGVWARELVGADYREIGVGVSFKKKTPLYVLLFALSWEDFFHEKTSGFADLERVRREMLARVNRERAAQGLAPLRRHPRLDDAAQAHAQDMFTHRYYSHDTPEGKSAMDRIQALGYRARYAGENIARGQYSVDEVMDGWMESKTHREHLLSPIFDDVGFGLAFGKNPGGYEILWVQNFGRPKGRERL
jgi:uncharacterized protein YkwD